jgi:hypothetical protein
MGGFQRILRVDLGEIAVWAKAGKLELIALVDRRKMIASPMFWAMFGSGWEVFIVLT